MSTVGSTQLAPPQRDVANRSTVGSQEKENSNGQMCPNCSGLNTNAVKACGGFTYEYICNDCKYIFTVRLFIAGAAA